MSRVSYVNGKYLPYAEAKVNVEDRGYQFADGVYEVIAIYKGCIVDKIAHLERLARSLEQLQIEPPVSTSSLCFIMSELIRKNYVLNGKLYIQITRGVAPRDHAFPEQNKSTLIVMTSHIIWPSRSEAKQGCSVITTPDLRWGRCDIKSVSLLANVLAKQLAKNSKAEETWMVSDEGYITEGTASNAWIIDKNDEIITRQIDQDILAGVTRKTIIKLAKEDGLVVREQEFTVEEAQSAKEAFLSSTTAMIKPITQINGKSIDNGESGSLTCALIEKYFDFLENLSRAS